MVIHRDGLRYYQELYHTLFILADKVQEVELHPNLLTFVNYINQYADESAKFVEHMDNILDHLRQEDNTLKQVLTFLDSFSKHEDQGIRFKVQDRFYAITHQPGFSWEGSADKVRQMIKVLRLSAEIIQRDFESLKGMHQQAQIRSMSPDSRMKREIIDNSRILITKIPVLEVELGKIAKALLSVEEYFSEDLEYLKKKETAEEAFRNNLKSWVDWARAEAQE